MCLAPQVSFWEYTWASSVGVLPGMAFFIYLGSLAHNLLDIGSTQPALNSPAAVATIALSGVMITLVAALTGAAADNVQLLSTLCMHLMSCLQHVALARPSGWCFAGMYAKKAVAIRLRQQQLQQPSDRDAQPQHGAEQSEHDRLLFRATLHSVGEP